MAAIFSNKNFMVNNLLIDLLKYYMNFSILKFMQKGRNINGLTNNNSIIVGVSKASPSNCTLRKLRNPKSFSF